MNKYHARKCHYNGYDFDSKKERDRYKDLCLLVKAEEITDLAVHPKFVLQKGFIYRSRKIRPIVYEADFSYQENGITIVEDVKSVATKTQLFKVKVKMFKKVYPELVFRIEE